MTRFITIFCFAFAALFTSSVNAQLNENFDSYTDGDSLHGVNGWEGWNDTSTATGLVSNDQSQTAPNSVEILPTTDLIHRMGQPSSGVWECTVEQYIPSGSTGDQYFIMLNTYNVAPGDQNWSVQMLFDNDTGMMEDIHATMGDPDNAPAPIPIIYDTWVPIRMVIDLDNNTLEQHYNGSLYNTTMWFDRPGFLGGSATIGALDLFSDGGSTIFYDNVVLKLAPVVADTMTVDRGIQTGGTLADTFESDDSYVSFHPGLTLNAMEAPVRLIFDGTLPSDSPNTLDLVLESSAVTAGQFSTTLEAWNWNTPGWDVVDVSPASVGSDTVTPVELTSDYVQSGTGAVRSRVGWRVTGLVAQNPWEVQLDQLVWKVDD